MSPAKLQGGPRKPEPDQRLHRREAGQAEHHGGPVQIPLGGPDGPQLLHHHRHLPGGREWQGKANPSLVCAKEAQEEPGRALSGGDQRESDRETPH